MNQTRTEATEARHLPAPPRLSRLPLPLWAVATLPIRNTWRTSLMFGLSPEERQMIGFDERVSDRVSQTAHRAFWRVALPHPAADRVGLAIIAARSHRGQPTWRGR